LNEETKKEIDRLDHEITAAADQSSCREKELAYKLEEAYEKLRDEATLHQGTRKELTKYVNMYNEQKALLRQEHNNVRLLQMENDTVLRQCSMERESKHKMKRTLVEAEVLSKTPRATHRSAPLTTVYDNGAHTQPQIKRLNHHRAATSRHHLPDSQQSFGHTQPHNAATVETRSPKMLSNPRVAREGSK